MQVTLQYAADHEDIIDSAVSRGEPVEIVRPGKPALFLVAKEIPTQPLRVLGSKAHIGALISDEAWEEADREFKEAVRARFEAAENF